MTVKGVLFDLFDTLIIIRKNQDFYSPSLMRMFRYLNENGINAPIERFQEAYDRARDELYAKADLNLEEPHFNVRTALTLNRLGYNYEPTSPLVSAACAEWCDEFVKYVYLDNEAEPLLGVLYPKYKMGIISNYAIPECANRLLRTYRLDGFFGAVVISGTVNKRKPSPEIFNMALADLEVSPSEAVFVGDTLDADVTGAKSVGMKVIYVKRREEKPIEEVQPDVTVLSLSEIPSILANW